MLALSNQKPINFEYERPNNYNEGLKIKISKTDFYLTVTYKQITDRPNYTPSTDEYAKKWKMITRRVEARCDSAMLLVKILSTETLECSDTHLTIKSFEGLKFTNLFTLFEGESPFSMSTVVDISIPLNSIEFLSIDLDKYLHYLKHHKRVFFCKNLKQIRDHDTSRICGEKIRFDFELLRLSDVETKNVLKMLSFWINNDGLNKAEEDIKNKDDPMIGSISEFDSIAKIDHFMYDQSAPSCSCWPETVPFCKNLIYNLMSKNCDSLTIWLNKNSNVDELLDIFEALNCTSELKNFTLMANLNGKSEQLVNLLCQKLTNLNTLTLKICDKSKFDKSLMQNMVLKLDNIEQIQIKKLETIPQGMQFWKELYKYKRGSVSF